MPGICPDSAITLQNRCPNLAQSVSSQAKRASLVITQLNSPGWSSFSATCNGRVAEALKNLQLRTWSSAAPAWCLNQRATEELKALGDIDVLAVGPGGSCVWIVEAKDLKLCRTLGEAARRLSEYRGKLTQKGKPDKLLRHLQRVSYIRKNASALCNRLALSAAPKVCGLVIVHAPQPMEQIKSDTGADGTFVMLSDIGKVPWATGWPTKT